jgi:hypothetical protein
MYNQIPWKPGTAGKGFHCEKCNCNGHATFCMYDQEVAEKRMSMDIRGKYRGGGVCVNCTVRRWEERKRIENVSGKRIALCARSPRKLPNLCGPRAAIQCAPSSRVRGLCFEALFSAIMIAREFHAGTHSRHQLREVRGRLLQAQRCHVRFTGAMPTLQLQPARQHGLLHSR